MALIKTKVIAKTKAGNSVTLTSSGAVYGGATSGNAKYAETAGYAEKAGYANEAAHAASAADLDPAKQAELDDKYLYRKEEDTALERITFEKGITTNGSIEANADVNIKGETNADGLVHANAGATFGDLFSFDENGNIVAHTITSSDFDTLAVSDNHKDKKGYTIAVKDSTDGTYKLLIDELRAWSKTITEELVVSGNASNGDFVSGFLGGKGWGITPRTVINSAGVEEQKWTAEFDNIVVRGGLKVYEMVVSQLVGENDNRVFTGMLEVDHYDKESGKVYLNTNDGQTYNPFRTGDYIMVQQFTYDTSESNDVTKGYELIVEEYGNEGEGENMLAWVTFSNFTSSFIENPTPETLIAEGDTFVRVDNISDPDRKGIVQIVSVGTATPYMDVIQGMKTDPTDSLKARLGNLAGIIHPNFGSLEGFGLYSSNAYLTGDFTLRRTGEDLDTKFQILEDKFSSRFAKAEDGLTDDANFLHNGRFNLNDDGEIDGWTEQGDDGEWFLGTDGLPLMINGQTTKDGLDRIVLENVGGKKVLHMYSANGNTVTMSQANELIKQPTTHTEYTEPEYTTTKDGNGNICDVTTTKEAGSVEVPDTLYLSAKLLPKAGTTVTLTLGETQGSTIAISKTYDADAKEWETVEQAGTWDGKGGFALTVDGDCYVTDVMLTTDSTENLKASYETSITQTAKEIELQAAKTTNLGTQIGYVKVEADKVSAKVTSLEKGLEDTGIDITDKKILATADNFVVRNNNGATTMTIDKDGNLCTSGDAAIKGTVKATSGSIGGVTINSNSIATDAYSLNSDGSASFADGNITFSSDGSGSLKNIHITGSIRSDIVLVGPGSTPTSSDAWTLNTSYVNNYNWAPKSDKINPIGRTIHIFNYRYNGVTQSGTSTITLTDGSVFFEDGIQKTKISVSRQGITLFGLGDNGTFLGWVVMNRCDIATEHSYGRQLRLLAYGYVVGTSSGATLKHYHTYDGSSMSVSRSDTGKYTVKHNFNIYNDGMQGWVSLTGVGAIVDNDSCPCKATLMGTTSTSFEVWTSDDSTVNDGNFSFMLYNCSDFNWS